jgi:hypothetical protein
MARLKNKNIESKISPFCAPYRGRGVKKPNLGIGGTKK